MAGANGDISSVERSIEKLTISTEESAKSENDTEREKKAEPRLWGFEARELYKMAINFYKGESGRIDSLARIIPLFISSRCGKRTSCPCPFALFHCCTVRS